MKCHFTYVNGMKVWIPGCYSGIYTEGYCQCRIRQAEDAKQRREDPEYRARKENVMLWKENARLLKIIDRLKKGQKQ